MKRAIYKLIISCVSIIIMFTCVFVCASEKVFSYEIYDSKTNFGFTNVEGLETYLFIHSLEKERDWYYNNIVGICECKENYLYVKNFDNHKIIQLSDKPIKRFTKNEKYAFYIYNGAIYQVDYINCNKKVLYKNRKLNDSIIACDNESVYCVEDNYLIKINVENISRKILLQNDGIISIGVGTKDTLIINCKNNISYEYNVLNKTSKEIEFVDDIVDEKYDNEQINQKISRGIFKPNHDLSSNYLPIMGVYSAGEYFTTDGNPSDSSHSNSYYYGTYYHCAAFALYCFDVFSHKIPANSSSPIADTSLNSEKTASSIDFLSESDIEAYLNFMSAGSLVRFYVQNSNVKHSMFIVNSISASLYYVLESNWQVNNKNTIQYNVLSSNQLLARMRKAYYSYSHVYSSVSNYSGLYHKYNCSRCNGYIYENHFTTDTGNIRYCDVCESRMEILHD